MPSSATENSPDAASAARGDQQAGSRSSLAVSEVLIYAARLGQVGIGVPDQPGARDRRFADRAWAGNPVLQRLALGYLATCDAASGILQDADVDWRTRERFRLTFDNVVSALAPTNGLLTNPESWKEVIDTGGQSLRAGLGNLGRCRPRCRRWPEHPAEMATPCWSFPAWGPATCPR